MARPSKPLLWVAAAAVALPRFAWAQQAYKAEYKMSTVVPPAFAWGKGGEIFGNLVRERTNGRINIKQYPGASLVQGQQDREFAAMRQGIIDVLCGAPINWSGTVRELGVFTLPFILPDHKAWDAATSEPACSGPVGEGANRPRGFTPWPGPVPGPRRRRLPPGGPGTSRRTGRCPVPDPSGVSAPAACASGRSASGAPPRGWAWRGCR